MMKYTEAERAVKVRITYSDTGLVDTYKPMYTEGEILKVYKVRLERFPSGQKFEFLVWSKAQERCVWVREGRCEIVEMSEEKIHTIK